MIQVHIQDETASLEAVILGTAESSGGVPTLEKTYDPKSREHILAGTYPNEEDLIKELQEVELILKKYNVEVHRPSTIPHLNQIFARDIAFVLDGTLVIPCVTPERKLESEGIEHIVSKVEKVLLPDEHLLMEGGDIIPWNGYLFVGYSKKPDFERYTVARTNEASLDYLKKAFPEWKVLGFELNKSDSNAKENALHLDCCFQPVGRNKAVIYPEGFKHREDVQFLKSLFKEHNLFEIDQEEMYHMNSNFFSISPEVVISDTSFTRLNNRLTAWGLKVEGVKYREIAKMEGLLRCTTMPLRRSYV
ncbi:MAG: arginine deiminase family protein [Bacteroidota bacterium]